MTELAKTDKRTKIAGTDFSWEEMSAGLARRIPDLMPQKTILEWAFFLLSANPSLAECTPDSFAASLLKAHSLGLDPTLPNTCWLIPRNNSKKDKRGNWIKVREVSFQMGYQGLRGLAMGSGSYRNVVAHVVHENDDFDVELVTGAMHHRPCFRGLRGEPICAYSVAISADGYTDPEVMTVEDVNAIRNRSEAWKGGKSNPWQTDWSEMARKTVLKRHCKRLDMKPEAARALRDEDAEPIQATVTTPAVDLAALPTVQKMQALPQEEALPVEPIVETVDVWWHGLPKFAAGSASKAESKGVKSQRELYDYLKGGGKVDGMSTVAKDFLTEKFGEPETPSEGVYSDTILAEYAQAIEDARGQGMGPLDYLHSQVVESAEGIDGGLADEMLRSAAQAIGVSLSSCTNEQMAEVLLKALA